VNFNYCMSSSEAQISKVIAPANLRVPRNGKGTPRLASDLDTVILAG
jgi:hypothetical protein